MKKRILFVDDDSNILDGHRRALRAKREEWDLLFLDSGEKAVKFLNKFPIDVVVTDMRMPDMDGAALLNTVRKLHPKAVRVILSGYAEEESVLRTVGPAHQYLAKPCDTAAITDTIIRALGLRRFLDNEDLMNLVSGLNYLPIPPGFYMRLLRQLCSDQSTVVEIADTISEDVAMTAQTMKLTNSAYFSRPQKIDSLHTAVSMLGRETLKSLVLVAGFFKKFSGDDRIGAQIEKLSRRSMSIGMAAQAIAEREGMSVTDRDQASSAGVLIHIGTLTLLGNWPDRFEEAIEVLEADDTLGIVDAERRIFGAGHPEIGAYLLGLWGFTDPITEAVAYHHAPREFSAPTDGMSVLVCVYAAQLLLKTIEASEDDESDLEVDDDIIEASGLDMDYLADLGVADRVPGWINLIRDVKAQAE